MQCKADFSFNLNFRHRFSSTFQDFLSVSSRHIVLSQLHLAQLFKAEIFIAGWLSYCRLAHQVCHWICQFWFDGSNVCLFLFFLSAVNMAELASHFGQNVGTPNQSQQNIADLMVGHPVLTHPVGRGRRSRRRWRTCPREGSRWLCSGRPCASASARTQPQKKFLRKEEEYTVKFWSWNLQEGSKSTSFSLNPVVM